MTKSATISVKDGEQRITILVSNGDPERVLSTIENAMGADFDTSKFEAQSFNKLITPAFETGEGSVTEVEDPMAQEDAKFHFEIYSGENGYVNFIVYRVAGAGKFECVANGYFAPGK